MNYWALLKLFSIFSTWLVDTNSVYSLKSHLENSKHILWIIVALLYRQVPLLYNRTELISCFHWSGPTDRVVREFVCSSVWAWSGWRYSNNVDSNMKSQFFWPSSADTEQELFDTRSRNEEESSDDTTAAENDDSEVDTSVEREDPSRDTADTFVTIWWTQPKPSQCLKCHQQRCSLQQYFINCGHYCGTLFTWLWPTLPSLHLCQ